MKASGFVSLAMVLILPQGTVSTPLSCTDRSASTTFVSSQVSLDASLTVVTSLYKSDLLKVVGSLEGVCDANLRSGFLQAEYRVLDGRVFANATKIIIKGFRHWLDAGDNAYFYAGLTEGALDGNNRLQNANLGTNGRDNEFVYLPFDNTANPITEMVGDSQYSDLQEVTLDLTLASQVAGFVPGVDTAQKLKWLSISNGYDTFARFDFTPHFRGGSLIGLMFQAAGQILVEGSDATEVKCPIHKFRLSREINWWYGNVGMYVGLKPWAESRDQLARLEYFEWGDPNPNPAEIRFVYGATYYGQITSDNPPQSPIDISYLDGINTVKDIKWLALHNAMSWPEGGIVAYVTA